MTPFCKLIYRTTVVLMKATDAMLSYATQSAAILYTFVQTMLTRCNSTAVSCCSWRI